MVGPEGFKPFCRAADPVRGGFDSHTFPPHRTRPGGCSVKAIALLSGGLDSILAARLLLEQDIEVVGLSFESPFFKADGARAAADDLGIPLVVVDISNDVLSTVREPKHGYGKHVNPCIDCHALMVSKAADVMRDQGASFVVTGEVVGQRPKSQMRFGLDAVARESGLEGYLLRPLSARLLEPTIPEQEGWVDRERLLGLHGRTRKPQMELAERFGITRYESPAGGCLLTDENYARLVRDLMEHEGLSVEAVRLLAVGRQFRLPGGSKLIVGRNHAENESLFEMKPPGELFVKAYERKGPVAILSGSAQEDDRDMASRIVARYADTEPDEEVVVELWADEGDRLQRTVTPMRSRDVRGFAV
ncbi:MAG: tRNA 4-thiouridine(8) synthase ThiI [Candidatus Eisenbacteria bacterium]|nr:tRNA 4-thiouridine(8) synthase ThiI [Candidatus Eisenbacteria bacterium]